MVAHGDALNGSDLVLPLAGHDLGVGARHLDASVEAGSVVSVGDDSAEAVVRADGAVVGTLGTGVAVVRPAEGPRGELSLGADERVLLLDAEPGLFLEPGVEDLLGVDAEVGVGRLKLLAGGVGPLVGLGHDDDVVALAEWVSEVGDGSHDDL